MTPLRPEFATHYFGSSEQTAQGVGGLFVGITEQGFCVSRWEPTPDELETLIAGGSVELWVMGCQPPVMLIARPHTDIAYPDALPDYGYGKEPT